MADPHDATAHVTAALPAHAENHDHDGTPTQKLLAANSHESPSADTHHAKDHSQTQHTGIGTAQTVLATSDTSESLGVGLVDATGLSFSIAASKTYHFEFYVLWETAATTTGIWLSVNGPASPTKVAFAADIYQSTTTVAARSGTAYDGGSAGTGGLTGVSQLARFTGIVVNGTNAGTLQLRFQTEIPTSAVTVKAGSGGWLQLMN